MKYLILLFLIIFLFNCQDKTENLDIYRDSEEPEIELESFYVPDEVLTMVEHAENFTDIFQLKKKIELEITIPESIIVGINFYTNPIQIKNDIIFIMDENKVSMFDLEGNYLKRIGDSGTGPGRYDNPSCFTIVNDKIIIVDRLSAANLLIFDLEGNYIDGFFFQRKVKPVNPRSIFAFNDNIFYFSTTYFKGNPNRHKVAVSDLNFNYLYSFADLEKYHYHLNYTCSSNIKTKHGTFWIRNTYKPTIDIYTYDGRFVKETGRHLVDLGLVWDTDKLEQLKDLTPCHPDQGKIRNIIGNANRNALRPSFLVNYNDLLVIHRISLPNQGLFCDVYDINGNHLKMIKLCEDIKGHLVSSHNEFLIFIDMWSEEIELDDDINAVLYFYRLKDL